MNDLKGASTRLLFLIHNEQWEVVNTIATSLRSSFKVWDEGFPLYQHLINTKDRNKLWYLTSSFLTINNLFITRKNFSLTSAFLALSIEMNDKKMVEITLKFDIDLNAQIRGIPLLHLALVCGNQDIIKLLLSKGASASTACVNGLSPFCVLVNLPNFNLELANMLLGYGANVNDNTWTTPLHVACLTQNLAAVTFLLSHGANVNAKDKNGETPLHTAVRKLHNNLPCVNQLLFHKADTNIASKEGLTPLYIAVEKNDIDLVKALLKCNANVHELNLVNALQKAVINPITNTSGCVFYDLQQYGFSFTHNDINDELLHASTKRGLTDIVANLLHLGADPNCTYQSEPLLHTAIKHGHHDIVYLLVQTTECDLNLIDGFNETPLSLAISLSEYTTAQFLIRQGSQTSPEMLCLAAKNCNIDLIKLLLNGMAFVNYRDDEGHSPIFYVLTSDTLSDLLHEEIDNLKTKIVKLLIKHNVSLDTSIDEIEDITELPILHYAIMRGYILVTRLLLHYGTRTKKLSKGKLIWSAIHVAAEYNMAGIIIVLVKSGVGVDSKCDGQTPLQKAVEVGASKSVRILLQIGAKATVKNMKDGSLIHIAAAKGFSSVIGELIAFGLNPDRKDINGKTPLHLAVANNKESIVAILLSHGADINAVCKKGLTPFMQMNKCPCAERIVAQNNWFAYENGRRIASPETVLYTILRHVFKMACVGLPLHECYAHVLRLPFNKEFISSCEKEIEKLKILKVGGSIFLCQLIRQWNDPVYLNNETLDFSLTGFSRTLPLYSGILMYAIKQGRIRLELMNTGHASFSLLLHLSCNNLPVLPDEMVRKVVYLMGNDDLKNLIEFEMVQGHDGNQLSESQ